MRVLGVWAFAGGVALFAAAVGAAEGPPILAEAEESAVPSDEEVTAILNNDVRTLEDWLGRFLSRRWDFVDVSYVSPSDSSGEGGWRADYNWSFRRTGGEGFSVRDGAATVRNVVLGANVDGSYALGDSVNTEEYSRAVVDLGFERGGFGKVSKIGKVDSVAYQECLTGLDVESGDVGEGMRGCAESSGVAEYVPDGRESWFLVASLHFSLEGDQDFSATNEAVGGSVVYAPPGGWPSVGIGLEGVDPSGNDARVAVAGDEHYSRWTLRLSYKANLEAMLGTPIWLFLGYRRFEELDPTAAVRDAGMHRFGFLSASLRIPASTWSDLPGGDSTMLFVRYTKGDLPFDVASKSAVEIGFSYGWGG